jgi:hypothetical protein
MADHLGSLELNSEADNTVFAFNKRCRRFCGHFDKEAFNGISRHAVFLGIQGRTLTPFSRKITIASSPRRPVCEETSFHSVTGLLHHSSTTEPSLLLILRKEFYPSHEASLRYREILISLVAAIAPHHSCKRTSIRSTGGNDTPNQRDNDSG